MPVTTYLFHEPSRHPDPELAELVDEINSLTGEKWYAQTVVTHVKKRWFGKNIEHSYTELLKHIRHTEYQDFQCVKTIREAKAYLIGAVGNLRKVKSHG